MPDPSRVSATTAYVGYLAPEQRPTCQACLTPMCEERGICWAVSLADDGPEVRQYVHAACGLRLAHLLIAVGVHLETFPAEGER